MNNASFLTTKNSILSTSNLTNTLSDKIIQCWMRQNHTDYQQLLIQTKQLQLALLQQQAINRNLLRNFETKKKQIDELQQKYNTINSELMKKKNYLISYYKHLNDKLKSQKNSINLFSKLQALTATLNSKLQAQKNGYGETITKLKTQTVYFQQQLQNIQNKKTNLQQNLEQLKHQKQLFKQNNIKKRQQQHKNKIEQKIKYEYLMKEVQKKLVQKQQLQHNQNILKKLLNIEEIHKKYWMIIEKSIKTQFERKIMQKNHRETMEMEYKLKVTEMENLINQRKKEFNDLEGQVVTVKKKRDLAQKVLDQNNKRFHDVENQLQNLSPTKSTS